MISISCDLGIKMLPGENEAGLAPLDDVEVFETELVTLNPTSSSTFQVQRNQLNKLLADCLYLINLFKQPPSLLSATKENLPDAATFLSEEKIINTVYTKLLTGDITAESLLDLVANLCNKKFTATEEAVPADEKANETTSESSEPSPSADQIAIRTRTLDVLIKIKSCLLQLECTKKLLRIYVSTTILLFSHTTHDLALSQDPALLLLLEAEPENSSTLLTTISVHGYARCAAIIIQVARSKKTISLDNLSLIFKQAASNKQARIVRVILAQCTDFTAVEKETLFLKAASYDKEVMLTFLEECDISINCKDTYDRTALMYAVSSQHKECTETLLLRRADATIVDSLNNTPLQHATHNHLVYFIHLLQAYKTNPAGIADFIARTREKELQHAEAKLESKSTTPALTPEQTLRQLCVNCTDLITIISIAQKMYTDSSIKLPAEQSIPSELRELYHLLRNEASLGMSQGFVDITVSLLNNEQVRVLTSTGEIILQKNTKGAIEQLSAELSNFPASHSALYYYLRAMIHEVWVGKTQLMRLLCQIKPRSAKYLLDLAIEKNLPECVSALMQPDVLNYDQDNSYENPPLQLAAYHGHHEIVQLLLQQAAFAPAIRQEAFFYATVYGHVKAAQMFLTHGDGTCRQEMPLATPL